MPLPALKLRPSIRIRARCSAAGAARARSATLVSILAAALVAGCAASQRESPAAGQPAERIVYVVRHGWHTGVVFRAADLPADSPLRRDFPHADHIEAGWGDRDYYMTEDPGLWLGIRALLRPTPGALHVVGLSAPPRARFPEADVVELGVSRAGLQRMHERVRSSFAQAEGGALRPLGPGLYGNARFYASREAFHAFQTCNVWTAQVLHAGGVPVTPATAPLAGMLLRQLEPHGRRIPPQPDPALSQ